jgi:hypothetical protein
MPAYSLGVEIIGEMIEEEDSNADPGISNIS